MPRDEALRLLGMTQAQAKMWEFGIPESDHIALAGEPATLFDYAIWAVGEETAVLSGDDLERPSEDDGRFASRFFDAYRRSRLAPELDQHTTRLAAAAFRLFGMPGAGAVLGTEVASGDGFKSAGALEYLATLLVMPNFDYDESNLKGAFSAEAARLGGALMGFEASGGESGKVLTACDDLRTTAYRRASAHELLLADIVCALARVRIRDSVWTQLPASSDLPVELWRDSLLRKGALRVMWPSQRALGAAGVYRGESAVVQMPTSAGKTRSIELIVRSAFFSGRTSTGVVIAPFRALCHEIRRDLQ